MPETATWLRATRLRGALTLRRPVVLAGLLGYLVFLVIALYALRGRLHEPPSISPALDEVAVRWSQLAAVGLPTVLATAIAGNRESRQLQVRAISGEPPLAQLATTVVLTMLLGIATWALSLIVALAFSWMDRAVDPVPGSNTYDLPAAQLLTNLTRGPGLTLLVGVAGGLVIGLLARTATAAVSSCVVIGGLGQLLVLVAHGLIGVVGWAAVVTPSGVADAAGGGPLGGVSQDEGPPAALVVTTLAVLVALAITWRRGRRVTSIPLRGRRITGPRRARSRHRLVIGLAIGVAAALAWGLVVPIALRSEVPWQLRPAWIADVRSHRSSEDIARRFLADVHAGRVSTAGRYTRSAAPSTLLGPFLPIVRDEKPNQLYVVQRTWGDPGTVSVSYPSYTFTLCMQRDTAGWYVRNVNTTGTCPKVAIG